MGSRIGVIFLFFFPVNPTADHSTLSASPASVPADGVTPSTITLQAKDAHGRHLTTGGLSVSLTHNGSSGVNLSNVTDHQDGTYGATITNTTAELGGYPLANTADVDFIPPSNMLAGGIIYNGVTIGTQTWTAENMRHEVSYGLYRSYDNDVNNDANGYGKLYNGGAAMNGSTTEGAQGICGVGWHIPSDNDWKILEGYLGMTTAEQDVEGCQLYRGTDQGAQLKVGGSSGFEALLAGILDYNDYPFNKERGVSTYFWTSSFDPNHHLAVAGGIPQLSYSRRLSSGNAKVERNQNQNHETAST